MKRIRRPSPAMVVAVIALVAALAGTSFAALKLGKNSVHARNIAPNAVTNKHTANWKTGPIKRVTAAASLGAAPEVVLVRRDALRVYGKCYESGADQVTGEIYIGTSKPDALVQSDDAQIEGDPPLGYLDPGEVDEAEVLNAITGAAPDADTESHSYFHAIQGSTAIDGLGIVFAKNGDLPDGGGPYGGAGDRCVFQAVYGGIG